MKTCLCSLAGTDACLQCNNNHDDKEYSISIHIKKNPIITFKDDFNMDNKPFKYITIS